jgi:RNA polymerase sigma factor for flagellar operon FliA
MGLARHDHRMLGLLQKVRIMATGIARRMPSSVCLDDLIAAGNLGVATALKRYPTVVTGELEAFALVHARGAIFDELRRQDPMTRADRLRARQIAAAIRALRTEMQREPEDAEVAHAAGLDIETYQDLRVQMSYRALSTDASDSAAHGEAVTLVEAAKSAEDELSEHQHECLVKKLLWDEVAKLPARQAQTITQSFGSDQRLSSIGKGFGVSQGRVSQIRTEALAKLRVACAAHETFATDAAA